MVDGRKVSIGSTWTDGVWLLWYHLHYGGGSSIKLPDFSFGHFSEERTQAKKTCKGFILSIVLKESIDYCRLVISRRDGLQTGDLPFEAEKVRADCPAKEH